MVSDSGPRLGCTGSPGWLMLAAAQCSRFERLLWRTASASTGSPATGCMYFGVSVALFSSSSGSSSGASRTILAPCCISSQTRFDGTSQPTDAAYKYRCTMHRHKSILVRDALATQGEPADY